MKGEDEDLFSFLRSYGISGDELEAVLYELESFRTIPGTTLRRYMNRVIGSIEQEDRPAFLKGILLGVAIRTAIEDAAEPPLTEEEKRINREIERLGLGR